MNFKKFPLSLLSAIIPGQAVLRCEGKGMSKTNSPLFLQSLALDNKDVL